MEQYATQIKELSDIETRIKELENNLGIKPGLEAKSFTEKLQQLLSKFQVLKERSGKENRDNDYDNFLKRCLEGQKEKYIQKRQSLGLACTFNTKLLLDFLKNIIEKYEKSESAITIDKSRYLIKSLKTSKKPLEIPNNSTTNLYESGLLDKDNEIYKNYPYLYNILLHLIDYRLKHSFSDYIISEEAVFAYMSIILPFEYPEIIGASDAKIAAELIPLAQKIAEDIACDYAAIFEIEQIQINEAKEFLEALRQGKYNSLLDKKYWFGNGLNEYSIIKWNSARKKLEEQGIKCNEISRENYIVFAKLNEILNHIARISKDGSYYIRENGHSQTPATSDEIDRVETLKQAVLTREYSWREAREIIRSVGRLNMYTDYKFPHNIDQIVKAFNPTIITFYDKINNTALSSDLTLEAIKTRASLLLNNLTIDNLIAFFTTPNRDSIDEYIKRMILSMFDIPRLIYENHHGSFQNTLAYINEELATSSTLSLKACEILFNNPKNIISLTNGVLNSLFFTGHVEDILSECSKLQKDLNCNYGTVGYNDVNTLRLPDGKTISSTYVEDIKPQYATFQQLYDYFYQNASDLEFVEGCIELLGDVIITQIFREGNKRTAKCLFNELLISRGIIPPITDLNENEKELWNLIAFGRFDRYPAARERLLFEAIKINEMLTANQALSLPTNVSLDAINREEFYKKIY